MRFTANAPRCMRAVSNLGGLLWLSVSGSGSRWAVPDFDGRSRISSKDLGFQWNAFEISEKPQVSMRVSNFNQGSQNRLEVPDRNDWCRISMIGVRSQRALPNLNEWVRWYLREPSGVATSNANAVGTMRPAADRGRNRRGEPDPTSRIQTA